MLEPALHNPFAARGMLKDPAQFHGRRAEVRRIGAQVAQGQSVSLVGERRIGKSSLLYHLAHSAGIASPEGARIHYLDLERVHTEADFYRVAIHHLGGKGADFHALERALAQRPAVLLLDEFERVAGNERFSIGFFDGLRGLAQDGLTVVTATRLPLDELCRDKQFSGSQFWNIFLRVQLALFSDLEAREYLRSRLAAAGTALAEEDEVALLAEAGCFPFFLQAAGYHAYEELTGGPRWRREFTREAVPHLHELWRHLSRHEQGALRWCAGYPADRPDEAILDNLHHRGLLLPDPERERGWRPFSGAFEGVVCKPPPPPRRSLSFAGHKIELSIWPPSLKWTVGG